MTATMCGCQQDSGDTPDLESNGYYLWIIAYEDIRHVGDIFDFLARYKYMQDIEDATQREEYGRRFLDKGIINVDGSIHTITYDTGYDTNYHITIEPTDNGWHISRSGGDGYALDIIDSPTGAMVANFEYLYHNESSGKGNFNASVSYNESGTPTLYFTGKLELVDYEGDRDKPLTVTTNITEVTTYTTAAGIIEGEMEITAYDALYDSTDTATATILKSTRQVVIESMGTNTVYRL